MDHVKFRGTAQESLFFDEVKTSVAAYFKERGISSRGNREMYFKVSFWLIFWLVSWWCTVLLQGNAAFTLLLGSLHMFSHVMIAFNITHDANHNALAESPRWNAVWGNFLNIIGTSRAIWNISHNQEHHSFINIDPHDNNIEGYTVLRLSPAQEWRPFHRFQVFYVWIFYAIATLNYVLFRDFKLILHYSRKGSLKLSPGFVLGFLGFKAFYISYVFLIPVLVFGLNIKLVLLYFLLGHFINGTLLVLIFVTGHLTEETSYPKPENHTVYQNWAVHVILTTGDYASRSRITEWFAGAINLHVAHHLFPRICHTHYKHISPIIKAVAEKHGYTYREIPSLRAAFASHIRLLSQLSRPDFEPVRAARTPAVKS